MMRKLVELARADEPPPLSREEADALIDAAIEDAERPARPRRAARRWTMAVIASAAIAAAALLGWFGWQALGRGTDPTALELPSGDRLTITSGATFRIERAEPAERLIELDGGTMLFDVVPLERGERFLVVTPHVRVEVRGTVFSVEVERSRSSVRVFSGRVEVFEGSRRTTVDADQILVSSARELASLDDDGPLGDIAREAAREHERRASTYARELPFVAEPVHTPEPEIEEPAVEEAPAVRVVRAEPARAEPEAVEPEEPPLAEQPTIAEVRAWIANGEAQRAHDHAAAQSGGSWKMIEAEALRALRRFDEAVAAFEQAAGGLGGGQRATAVFNAAQIAFLHLGNPTGAISILDRWDATAPGAPLEERALALRVRALRAAGRIAQAREQARYYLGRFPTSGLSSWMQGLADGAQVDEPTE
jgi:tetratricopeptide (TPR) repeat protein